MIATHKRMSRVAAVAIAVLAGLFLISAHDPLTYDAPLFAESHFHDHEHDYVLPHEAVPHDYEAFIDMYVHAALHFDVFRELPETFGGTAGWSDKWILHWIDIETEGHIVRVYHLTHKHHAGQRFVAFWDEHNAHSSDWLPAR
jgi:hypothetical protein